MQDRHTNKEKYFKEQIITTEKHVIPFIQNLVEINSTLKVAEIGCGEGGNLKPFLDIGCKVTGIDISESKIENAKKYFSNHKNTNNINLICDDIYNITHSYTGKFDLIIMRDAFEHIQNQDYFMNHIKNFLLHNGKIFFSFPPRQMPFGGHQQICKSKILDKLPYFHLLPKFWYKYILKISGESDETINGLLEIKQTGISIEKFKKIIKKNKYIIEKEEYYFINPNYEVKFNIKKKKLLKIFNLNYLRNFYTTNYYCIVSVKVN